MLNPTTIERVSVRLAAAATDETTYNALFYYASNREECSDFKQTGKYLQLVRKFFNIVNVKNDSVAKQLNNPDMVAIRLNDPQSEKNLDFLGHFGQWMKDWYESDVNIKYKLSKDTLMATYYTCRGIVAAARYLLTTYSETLEYLLLGKINSDRIERHFGHLRSLAGTNYWCSVQQMYQSETVIKSKSLVWLSGYSPGQVFRELQESQEVDIFGFLMSY